MPLESSETNKSKWRKTWRYTVVHKVKTAPNDTDVQQNVNAHRFVLCRQNASYVALEVTTLTQLHMALRPTRSMSTTWPITCERTSGSKWIHVPFVCAKMKKKKKINASSFFRFFLMYLINKDETEHTGQVSVTGFTSSWADWSSSLFLLRSFLL